MNKDKIPFENRFVSTLKTRFSIIYFEKEWAQK